METAVTRSLAHFGTHHRASGLVGTAIWRIDSETAGSSASSQFPRGRGATMPGTQIGYRIFSMCAGVVRRSISSGRRGHSPARDTTRTEMSS